jgi:mannan endo-1,4-beta-mannosidase
MRNQAQRHEWTTVTRTKLAGVVGAFLGAVVLAAGLAMPASATAALTLTPSSGSVGASVTVKGTSFPKKATGSVTFGTSVVGSFKAANSGNFSLSFAVPAGSSGDVPVTASGSGFTQTATFTVTGTSGATTTTTAPATTTTTAPAATTTTTAPATTTTTAPASSSGYVTRNGRNLLLNGANYKFTGTNAPDLSTDYTINYGCGATNSQTDVMNYLSSLRPNSMVRVWAFQSIAYNKNTKMFDFAVLDRVVNDAAQTGQKVILVLSHQWGGCGETFKTEGWYSYGYKQVVTDGTTQGMATDPLSFYEWTRKIVTRYANSPAVAMWEPVNEAKPTVTNGGSCSSTAANTLRTFFDSVGGLIHSIDTHHLVSSGLQGSGQCGTAGTQYQSLHQSAGIDVGSVHDYYAPDVAMPGDAWNGIQVRINQMAAVNKPLFVGEVGINASDTTAGLPTLSQRRDDFKAKMDAQLGGGIVGYIPWRWAHTTDATNYYIPSGDPSLTLLHDYAL